MTRAITGIVVILFVGTGAAVYQLVTDVAPPPTKVPTETEATVVSVENVPEIVDGIDRQTGLLDGEGLSAVKANCLSCHSARLVTQNRFTREGWYHKIVWMQETQGLWDLGDNESIILDYLAEHYSPEERAGRRQPLTGIEWYPLDD